jgi:hypothetical protein
MRTKSVLRVALLAVLLAGCGRTGSGEAVPTSGGTEPTAAATTTLSGNGPMGTGTKPPGLPPPTVTTAKVAPKVPGVPIDVDPNFGNGSSWINAETGVVEFLTRQCGGALCVRIKTRTKSSTPGDCKILGHAPAQVRPEETITFFLDSPCGAGQTADTTTTTVTTTTT